MMIIIIGFIIRTDELPDKFQLLFDRFTSVSITSKGVRYENQMSVVGSPSLSIEGMRIHVKIITRLEKGQTSLKRKNEMKIHDFRYVPFE